MSCHPGSGKTYNGSRGQKSTGFRILNNVYRSFSDCCTYLNVRTYVPYSSLNKKTIQQMQSTARKFRFTVSLFLKISVS
jgi:hypothetical protein